MKVQDGYDNCSFCTIPLARGRSRSESIRKVLENVKIAAGGAKEIVLTGINLGDFGKGHTGGRQHEEDFFGLIRALDENAPVERFRISSIEPNLLSNEMMNLSATAKNSCRIFTYHCRAAVTKH